MRISHTHPYSFNFLNGMGIIIILNKLDEVGMGATHPKLIPLPSLLESGLVKTQDYSKFI